MTDDDTLVIGYDTGRGEPRGKRSDPAAGDCIDCKRCVVVCPTGIDIRNGLQIDCIGCAACVDACDEIMGKIGRAPGLVRYDSLRGFDGGARRFWRPRLALYAVLGVIGLVVAPNPRAARGPARPAPGRAVPARGRRDPQQLRAAPGQQVRRADAPGAGR
jgi:polyferredoxin